MTPLKPNDPVGTATAVRSLHTSEPSAEYDSSNPAWVDFDLQMDADISLQEERLSIYLTRKAAFRKSLGR